MTSSQSTASQQVPAWKRLGLKLKQPSAATDAANGGTLSVGHPSSTKREAQSNKRKSEAPPATESPLAVKKARKDNQFPPSVEKKTNLKTGAKKVTFGDTPTKNGTPSATPTQDSTKTKTTSSKKNKGPTKKQSPTTSKDIKPALDYLQQWKTSREAWKFNKNFQSLLIERVFNADDIPAADIATFYEYIRDLKGFVRTRLRETAMEVKAKDIADGPSGFPAGTKEVDAKHETYMNLLSDFLSRQHIGKKRKGYDEVEFVASSGTENVIIRRVVKRLRAEIILDELSDGEQTDTSQTSQSSDNTLTTSDNHTMNRTDGEKQLKLNDGTAKRRRKLRVNVDDSSSSESESDSDSGSSSSSSSDSDDSDSDDDDEVVIAQGENGYESSSSSSSSSSSLADESDSDDDSTDDDD